MDGNKFGDGKRRARPGVKWSYRPQFLVSPLYARLPPGMVTNLLAFTDRHLRAGNSTDYSEHLAGRIERGAQVELAPEGVPARFRKLLLELSAAYIDSQRSLGQCGPEPYELSFVDMWVVSQREKDFNPIHRHGGQLSGIVYLKVPRQINQKRRPEGCLEFVYGRGKPETLDFNGNRTVLPVVGDMYIFPAWLQHLVYPFYGRGERRSLSFNIEMTLHPPEVDSSQ
ncbi:MAG: putative 2OG-Fe(II) oxygenase [Pyrinomonadaceae bacterium]